MTHFIQDMRSAKDQQPKADCRDGEGYAASQEEQPIALQRSCREQDHRQRRQALGQRYR